VSKKTAKPNDDNRVKKKSLTAFFFLIFPLYVNVFTFFWLSFYLKDNAVQYLRAQMQHGKNNSEVKHRQELTSSHLCVVFNFILKSTTSIHLFI